MSSGYGRIDVIYISPESLLTCDVAVEERHNVFYQGLKINRL